MGNQETRVGFVGSGYIARQHAEALRDVEGVRFSACMDVSEERALKLRSGAAAGIQATWASAVPASCHGVVGTAATALIEGPAQFEFDCLRLSQRDGEAERVYRFALPSNPLRAAGEHFIAAVRGEVGLEVTVADGLRALEVSAAMLASAREGGAAVAVDSGG